MAGPVGCDVFRLIPADDRIQHVRDRGRVRVGDVGVVHRGDGDGAGLNGVVRGQQDGAEGVRAATGGAEQAVCGAESGAEARRTQAVGHDQAVSAAVQSLERSDQHDSNSECWKLCARDGDGDAEIATGSVRGKANRAIGG